MRRLTLHKMNTNTKYIFLIFWLFLFPCLWAQEDRNAIFENEMDESSELRNLIDDETGTGFIVFNNSPALVTPDLGIPSAIDLSNATGLPLGSGVIGDLLFSNLEQLAAYSLFLNNTGSTDDGVGVKVSALSTGTFGSGAKILYEDSGGVLRVADFDDLPTGGSVPEQLAAYSLFLNNTGSTDDGVGVKISALSTGTFGSGAKVIYEDSGGVLRVADFDDLPTGGVIDLGTDVTGDLPFSNLTQLGAYSILLNDSGGTADAYAAKISDLSNGTFSSGDKFIFEESTGELRKADYDDLPSGGGSFDGDLELGVASVINLTADVDDWNPTGLSTETIIPFTSDGNYTISGMAAIADGKWRYLHNRNALAGGVITLAEEGTGSIAVNRFKNGTAYIGPGVIMGVYYSSADSRYIVKGVPVDGANFDIDPATGNLIFVGGGNGDRVSPLNSAEIAISTSTTLTVSRQHAITAASDLTQTLPAVSGNTGKLLSVRVVGSSAGLVTIDGDGSELIDGAATRVMWAGESAELLCDGTGWVKIGGKTIAMNAVITLTASQTIPDDTDTKIEYDTTIINVGSMTDIGNNEIDIRRAGNYSMFGSVIFDNLENTVLISGHIYKDAASLRNIQRYSTGNGRKVNLDISVAAALAAGEVVSMEIFQNSGVGKAPRFSMTLEPTLIVTEIPVW